MQGQIISEVTQLLKSLLPSNAYIDVKSYKIHHEYVQIYFAPKKDNPQEISFSYCMKDYTLKPQMFCGKGGNYIRYDRSYWEKNDVCSYKEIPFEPVQCLPDQIKPKLIAFISKWIQYLNGDVHNLEQYQGFCYLHFIKHVEEKLLAYQ